MVVIDKNNDLRGKHMKELYTAFAVILLSMTSTLVLAQDEQEPMTFLSPV